MSEESCGGVCFAFVDDDGDCCCDCGDCCGGGLCDSGFAVDGFNTSGLDTNGLDKKGFDTVINRVDVVAVDRKGFNMRVDVELYGGGLVAVAVVVFSDAPAMI